MNINFNIRIDAPKGGLRRAILFGAVPVVLVAATAAIASATLSPAPSTWAVSKQPIPAASLAANLTQLDTRLSTLEAAAHPASAFHAHVSYDTLPMFGVANTFMAFDVVDYDLAGEYSASTGTFTPKQSGYYLIQCGFWSDATTDGLVRTVEILDNGTEIMGNDNQSGAPTTTIVGFSSVATTVAKLAANDNVVCGFSSSNSFQMDPYFADRNFFQATRLY